MKVYSYKRVHYTFPKGRWAIVRDVVCDTPSSVVSIAGLCCFGYSANFNYKKVCFLWKGTHRADAIKDRGLYVLEPKTHGRPHYPDNLLVAPIVSSSSAAPPKTTAEPTKLPAETSSTVDKSWHKDYRPQTYIRGSRRSGHDDDWVFTSDGKHAVRVHLRPRRTAFTPGLASMGQICERRLDLLGDTRNTHVVHDKSRVVISYSDDWRTAIHCNDYRRHGRVGPSSSSPQ